MSSIEKEAGSLETQSIIDQLSLQLLQQTELTNTLQSKIADLNRMASQQKQQLINARKEKHDADLEVMRLSTEVENITQELFEQANLQVKEANENAHDITQLNDRLAQTIKEKDTTIEILQSELSNLKSIISNFDSAANTPLSESQKNLSTPNLLSHSITNDKEGIVTADSPTLPIEACFNSTLLTQYNEQQIYSPLYNQLRFDLPAFQLFSSALIHSPLSSSTHSTSKSFDIKTSKFFIKLLDELDDCLKLEKAPALQTIKLRWNRKSFLLDLMEKTVNIEPLSAATESWKNQTLQKFIPQVTSNPPTPIIPSSNEMPSLSRFATSNTSVASYDPSMFKNANVSSNITKASSNAAPLAVTASCGLCGEKRKDMNYSRLYHLRILYLSSENNEEKQTKSDYPLCIYCANKYRSVVELLKFVSNINPIKLAKGTELDDYIRSSWIKYVNLRAKVWFTTEIGIWSEKEMYGLVYGWQNNWLTNLAPTLKDNEEISNNEDMESQTQENEINDDNTSVNETSMAETIVETVEVVSVNKSLDTNTDSHDNRESEPSSTSQTSSKSHKGWDGWSGVIAKPKSEMTVDVGIGLIRKVSTNRKSQHIEKETLDTEDNKESTDIDEQPASISATSSSEDFQDAIAISSKSDSVE